MWRKHQSALRAMEEVALPRSVGADDDVYLWAEGLSNNLVLVALEALNNHLRSAHSTRLGGQSVTTAQTLRSQPLQTHAVLRTCLMNILVLMFAQSVHLRQPRSALAEGPALAPGVYRKACVQVQGNGEGQDLTSAHLLRIK